MVFSLARQTNGGPSYTTKDKAPLKEDEMRCYICNKLRHTALECWHRYNQVYQLDDRTQALAATSLNKNFENTWYHISTISHMIYDSGG